MVKKKGQQEELLETLGDFTSKENWDKFFTIRGSGDSFEWYAEWPQLRGPLLAEVASINGAPSSEKPSDSADLVQILVPGCGNSRLSEHLYDAGLKGITNIDFSKVVISDMLRRNVRSRPGMRWRVMDMTSMQFVDETFDIVLDKGGLDALMEPELGSKLGNQYLSEVKRVLKHGGKFICLTLAESHVLGLLFPKFRYGWKMSLHAIPQKSSAKPSLHTFMVIAEKERSTVLHRISSSIEQSSVDRYGTQTRELLEALESENQIRLEHSNGSDIIYSLEDLQLGAKGDLTELNPGRRVLLTLGQHGASSFCYRAVLLDAQLQSGPFSYHCGVFLVPKARAREWLFSSEEGQWLIVESAKAARLIMVLLDTSHSNASMDEIQKDLSPLVTMLAPGKGNSEAKIPFMAAGDGIKQRNIIHQVTSPLTGPIIVDEVVYEKADNDLGCSLPSEDSTFRRLTFQRMENLVQSEALLRKDCSPKTTGKSEGQNTSLPSKSKRKGNKKRNDPEVSLQDDLNNFLNVDHHYLASSYHTGIVAGFMLISSCLEKAYSAGGTVKAVVIGLGAGLLPMFLHACLPILYIEVVELDPVVLDVARDYFGFREDDRLKAHIADGIQFVRRATNVKVAEGAVGHDAVELCDSDRAPSDENCTTSNKVAKRNDRTQILIVDVDSSDSSSGLTCPASDFVEESFLSTVKKSLAEQGLFVVNLVSRSSTVREMVVSRMRKVFNNLFHLELEEDVNEILFAINTSRLVKEEEDSFEQACCDLEKLLTLQLPERSQSIIDAAKKIKRL